MKSTTAKIANLMDTRPQGPTSEEVKESSVTPSASQMVGTPSELHVVLLVGTSSVGKSTLCSELKKVADEKHFHVVKNADEIIAQDHLPKIEQKFHEQGILNDLKPMRPDEIFRFCMYGHLNISKGEYQIDDKKIDDLTALEDVIESAGYDKETSSRLAKNLKSAKKLYDLNPVPEFEDSLKNSFKEALSPKNFNKTVVMDLVPEATPLLTEKKLDEFQEMADNVSKLHRVNIKVDRVLVFCSLEKLQENMDNRNKAAKENNLTDVRSGINPFLMLTSIATSVIGTLEAETKNSKANEILFSTSKSKIKALVQQLSSAEEVEKTFSELIGEGGEGYYGFRIPKEVEEKAEVAFCVPKDLHFHHTVNTTLRTPSELADELVSKLNIQRAEVNLGPKPRL